MAARLVDLEVELARVEDDREPARRALGRGQELDGLLGEGPARSSRSRLRTILVAAGAPAAARVGIAPALVLVAVDGVRLDPGADVGDDLLGQAAVGGGEGLPLALGGVGRFGEGDPLDRGGGPVGGEEVGDLGLERDRERVLLERRLVRPRAGGRSSRRVWLRRAVALARAIRTASPATRSASVAVRTCDAAKPHAPSTRTRTPNPSLSPEATPSTRPVLIEMLSSSRRTTRTSAYPAPRAVAVSRARSVRSDMRRGA